MLQQETLDPVPDEGPHDIEEENPAGDTPQDVAIYFVLAEKPAGAVRQHRKQPEGRQRGVEHQRAAKDAMCGAQPGVCRIGRGAVRNRVSAELGEEALRSTVTAVSICEMCPDLFCHSPRSLS